MINDFRTVFEARQDKFQIENIFRGETVDLIAKVTTDGVINSLNNYTAKGMYQPSDTLSTDVWYPIDATISGDSVRMRWTPANDLGNDSYIVFCLLEKPNETSYPLTWRINLQHSPGYPANPVQPIPHQIDFSQYDLLNAPWIEATETDTEWVVDKIVKVAGLDLDSLSAQDIVIAGGSLFDAVSSINQNITDLSSEANGKLDALSNDLSECCEAMNGKVDSLSTTLTADFAETNAKIDAIDIPTDYAKEATLTNVSSDVASIKETVEAISIPTDYAKENSVSAVKDAIDQIVNRTDYAKEATVASLSTSLGNSLESLSTHSDQISASLYGSVEEVASTASRIESKVDAITIPTDYAKQATLTTVSSDVASIKQTVEAIDIPTDYALSSQAKEIIDAVYDSDYGIPYIGETVNSINGLLDTVDIVANSVSGIVGNPSYGNQAIKNAVDAITIPTDYAKESTLTATKATVDSVSASLLDQSEDLTDIITAVETAQNSLEALSTHSDLISASLYDPIEEVSSTTLRIESKIDSLPTSFPTDYSKESTVQSLSSTFVLSANAIKGAVDSVQSSVDEIVIPTDYAKESTLNGIGSIVQQQILPTINKTDAAVANSTYGLSALQALLGDCATALDIINGEVL